MMGYFKITALEPEKQFCCFIDVENGAIYDKYGS